MFVLDFKTKQLSKNKITYLPDKNVMMKYNTFRNIGR